MTAPKPMTDEEIEEARALDAARTQGDWQWYGNVKQHEVYLSTVDRGHVFVMDFGRWGMQGGQPRFQVPPTGMRDLIDLGVENGPQMVGSHRNDFVGIGHPDARYIAAAPRLVRGLLATVDHLRGMDPSDHDVWSEAMAVRSRLEAELAEAKSAAVPTSVYEEVQRERCEALASARELAAEVERLTKELDTALESLAAKERGYRDLHEMLDPVVGRADTWTQVDRLIKERDTERDRLADASLEIDAIVKDRDDTRRIAAIQAARLEAVLSTSAVDGAVRRILDEVRAELGRVAGEEVGRG